MHSVVSGTGTPKDRDEVNRREVSECEGWVWDLDTIGAPSRFRLIRKAAALARIFQIWGVYTPRIQYIVCHGWLFFCLIVYCESIKRERQSIPTPGKMFVYYESLKREIKTKPIWISVWWKTKNYSWGIYTPRMHSVGRGTGTPKDRDEINRR